jgi:hypothetical protein
MGIGTTNRKVVFRPILGRHFASVCHKFHRRLDDSMGFFQTYAATQRLRDSVVFPRSSGSGYGEPGTGNSRPAIRVIAQSAVASR